MQALRSRAPALIAIGGFPGAGKTTQAKRLAFELHIPRLSADMLGQIIRRSDALKNTSVNAHWIAYDVLFSLCAEFLKSGVSVLLDVNLGHTFQWQELDALRQLDPEPIWLPIVLQCPREICMERIRQRYAMDPNTYGHPDLYTTVPHILSVWAFLEQLDRPDTCIVNAARSDDEVFADIKQHVTLAMQR